MKYEGRKESIMVEDRRGNSFRVEKLINRVLYAGADIDLYRLINKKWEFYKKLKKGNPIGTLKRFEINLDLVKPNDKPKYKNARYYFLFSNDIAKVDKWGNKGIVNDNWYAFKWIQNANQIALNQLPKDIVSDEKERAINKAKYDKSPIDALKETATEYTKAGVNKMVPYIVLAGIAYYFLFKKN